MTTRIPGSGIATSNPFGLQWISGQESSEHPDRVEERLFGRPPPPLLDREDEDCGPLLARLLPYKRKLAVIAQDRPEDYVLLLASSDTMAIDRQGVIYAGRNFLLRTASRFEVQVGAMGHEIGHRPKRWRLYREKNLRTQAEVDELCRLEETRADFFAGYGLAQLELDIEPLCAYILEAMHQPHPAYFSAELRADTLREGYEAGRRRRSNLAKFYPEFARMTNVQGDLGEG